MPEDFEKEKSEFSESLIDGIFRSFAKLYDFTEGECLEYQKLIQSMDYLSPDDRISLVVYAASAVAISLGSFDICLLSARSDGKVIHPQDRWFYDGSRREMIIDRSLFDAIEACPDAVRCYYYLMDSKSLDFDLLPGYKMTNESYDQCIRCLLSICDKIKNSAPDQLAMSDKERVDHILEMEHRADEQLYNIGSAVGLSINRYKAMHRARVLMSAGLERKCMEEKGDQ